MLDAAILRTRTVARIGSNNARESASVGVPRVGPDNPSGEFGLVLVLSGLVSALVGVGTMAWEPSTGDAAVFYAASGTLVVMGLSTVVLSARSASIPLMGTPGGAASADRSPAKIARMIELVEMQLLALTIERSDINARAMGVLAFDGALGALFVAGKDQLGPHIRIALLGLLIAVVLSLLATRPKPEVGPQPALFLGALKATGDAELDSALYDYLRLDVARNAKLARDSHRLIQNALGVTLLTVGYVTYLALLSRGKYGQYHMSFTP